MFNKIFDYIAKSRLKNVVSGRLIKNNIINRSLNCNGWTSAEKLGLLYDLVTQTECLGGDILEIGSAWGRSTVLIGLASNRNVWSVDPHTGGRAFIEKGLVQNSYDEFLFNINKNNLTSRVKILKHTTDEVNEMGLVPNDVFFSFAFIDGLHTPTGVLADIDLTYSRLIHNGIIVFDDYFERACADYASTIDEISNQLSLELVKNEAYGLVYLVKQ